MHPEGESAMVKDSFLVPLVKRNRRFQCLISRLVTDMESISSCLKKARQSCAAYLLPMTLSRSKPKQNNITYLPQHAQYEALSFRQLNGLDRWLNGAVSSVYASITLRWRPINGFEHYILEYISQGDRKCQRLFLALRAMHSVFLPEKQGEHDEIYV